MIISRDVLFNEKEFWNWKEKKVQVQAPNFNEELENKGNENEDVLEAQQQISPIASPHSSPSSFNSSSPSSTPRRMKSLSDVYASCNFCVVEPESFEEAIKEEAWKQAMEEEIHVIEKNKTWELVEKPKDKDVYWVEVYIQNQTQSQ